VFDVHGDVVNFESLEQGNSGLDAHIVQYSGRAANGASR
jgi:hypothetical protein